jgi:hypothetical protein
VSELQAENFNVEQLETGAGLAIDDFRSTQDEDRETAQLSVGADPAKGPADPVDGKSLACDHAGCSYVGTFRRQWELQRHVAVKHTTEKPFWCPVIGCIKGREAPAFARPDKLTAHIRAVHCNKNAQAICPTSTCPNTDLELELRLAVRREGHRADPAVDSIGIFQPN